MKRAICILALMAVAWASLPGDVRALSILLPTDRAVPPLTLQRHEQTVVISDQVARTTLHQVFHNPTGQTLEAFYLFPIPKGAQVTDFSMVMNGERVHGEVLESGKARAIYEDIVRRMRDPGLIEYMDDNLLRVRIFPIPPRGDQAIDLELTQVLPAEGGLVRYEFPFGADPGRSGLPAQRDAASLSIEINSDEPLAGVYSPTHTIDVEKKKDGRTASIAVDRKDLAEGRDFVLYYGSSQKDVGVNLVAYRPETDEPGYFMLLLSPRAESDDDEVIPKDVTFVLDTSGSMARDGKLDQAKDALIQCLGALREGDRFNLVDFSTDVRALSDDFLPADAASREKAERYIKKLIPRGGTNIEGALKEALKSQNTKDRLEKLIPRGGTNIEGALKEALKSEDAKDRLHVVVFMTDGQPTVGETVPKALVHDVERRNSASLRVFPFGIGYDVNVKLLDEIAEATRAAADYVKPKETIEQKVSAFFDKVSAPALTNGSLDIPGGDVFDLYPQTLPDLFQGQQLTVFGRYRKSGDTAITLEGKRGDKNVTYTFETSFPKSEENNAFIEPLWGTRKIGFLLDQIRRNGESEELREEVVDLAKKYNVVTPYTSYLVTEDQAAPVPLARNQPMTRRPGDQSGLGVAPSGVPPVAGAAGPLSGAPASVAGGMRATSVDAFGSRAEASAPVKAISQSMDTSTGQVAVDQSVAVREMKETESVGRRTSASSASDSRRVVGKYALVLRDGVWTDEKSLDKTDLPTVKIQFGSAAYFEFLKMRKDLKAVLQVGERVRVRLDKAIVEIGPEGATELSDAEKALLKR